MLIKITPEELPKNNSPQYNAKTISYLDLFKKINPLDSIVNDGILQVIVGMLFHLYKSGFPAVLLFPKGLSIIEAYNLPTVQSLINICEEFSLLLRQSDVAGIQVKGLCDDALNAYIGLSEAGKIDQCIKTLFRSNETHKYIAINKVDLYELRGEKFILNNNIIKLLLSNYLYMYLASEATREGKASIPLVGWSMEEIENSQYFIDLTKIFKKVYFIGGSSNDNWLSTYMIVTKPYEEIDTYFCRI